MNNLCTCIKDKEITCIVHPTQRALHEYIAEQQAIIESLETEGLQKDVEAQKYNIFHLEAQIAEVREIYAGMEGFEPETAPEAYCLRIIKQMYKAALGGDEDVLP